VRAFVCVLFRATIKILAFVNVLLLIVVVQQSPAEHLEALIQRYVPAEFVKAAVVYVSV
jgi:hypothetical protein